MPVIIIQSTPKWIGYLFLAVGITALISIRYALAAGEELGEYTHSLRKQLLFWTPDNEATERAWQIEKAIKRIMFIVLYVIVSLAMIIGGLIGISTN